MSKKGNFKKKYEISKKKRNLKKKFKHKISELNQCQCQIMLESS